MPLQNRSVRIGLLKATPAKWDVDANWDVFEEHFARHRDSGLECSSRRNVSSTDTP